MLLTLILLTWRIWWAPNNASKWQMEFNSTFKGLKSINFCEFFSKYADIKYHCKVMSVCVMLISINGSDWPYEANSFQSNVDRRLSFTQELAVHRNPWAFEAGPHVFTLRFKVVFNAILPLTPKLPAGHLFRLSSSEFCAQCLSLPCL
jgi:hypothetical protein